jgi:hypothetical protein
LDLAFGFEYFIETDDLGEYAARAEAAFDDAV